MKKLRLGQENRPAQGYTAGKWGELGLKPSTDRGLLENTPTSPVGKGVLSGEQAEEERPKYFPCFFFFFFCQRANFCSWYVWPSAHPQSFPLSPNPGLLSPDLYGQMEDQLYKHTKRGLTICRKYK